MSRFSDNLRRIRFEHHMTQEEFAALLDTTKQNISRYESGAVSPKITTAQAIADKLGMSLSELNGDVFPRPIRQNIKIDKEKVNPFLVKKTDGVRVLVKARPDEFKKHIDKVEHITKDKELFGQMKTTVSELDDDLKQLKAAIHINPELRDLIKMQATASKSEIKQLTAFLKAIREE